MMLLHIVLMIVNIFHWVEESKSIILWKLWKEAREYKIALALTYKERLFIEINKMFHLDHQFTIPLKARGWDFCLMCWKLSTVSCAICLTLFFPHLFNTSLSAIFMVAHETFWPIGRIWRMLHLPSCQHFGCLDRCRKKKEAFWLFEFLKELESSITSTHQLRNY